MKSKKALILPLEKLVNIVLGVIAILLLFLVLNGLYSVFKVKSEEEQAKAQLDNIVKIIENLGGETIRYTITNPKWHLLSFSGEKKICFCPIRKEWLWTEFDENYWKAVCRDYGICEDVGEEISFDIKYYKEHIYAKYGVLLLYPKAIYISKEQGKIVIRDYDKQYFNYIMLNLLGLKLDEKNIEISMQNILNEAEQTEDRKMAVVIGYRDNTGEIERIKIIPNEKKIKEIGENNFVIPGDKGDIAVFLIVQRK